MSASENYQLSSVTDEVKAFEAKLAKLGGDARRDEIGIEIAKQLMWIRTRIDELCEAVHRVADK